MEFTHDQGSLGSKTYLVRDPVISVLRKRPADDQEFVTTYAKWSVEKALRYVVEKFVDPGTTVADDGREYKLFPRPDERVKFSGGYWTQVTLGRPAVFGLFEVVVGGKTRLAYDPNRVGSGAV